METKQCAICSKDITRSKSHFKSKNVFCSRKHKEKGMILGLCAPMRLGTGYGVKDILRRRKYYKYRQFDRKNGYKEMEMGVREFCKKLSDAKCIYCNSRDDVGCDRIDNKSGHHETNTVWACQLCNMTRGDRFTVEQMKKLGKIIKTFYVK
jgi:hypothetical protein